MEMTDAAGTLARASANRALTLPTPVPAERREIAARAGRLACYVAGDGPPLLLIHSINAAASAYEVRPIFERATAHRRVYAVDLPGFGGADRSARRYDVRLYVDAIHDIADAIAAAESETPVDALALSLSSEFLARAAVERPERFRTLAFVTPTGFDRRGARRRGPEGATLEMPWLRRFFTAPPWSQALFDLLVSRRSIRFFLRKTFGSDDIDPGLIDYAYRTAHQPGARHAPFAFVSGGLFSADVRNLYERLSLPVWVTHATRGDFADFSGADWIRSRPNWTAQRFDTGALPQFEQANAFFAAYEAFLAAADATAQASAARSPMP